MKKDWDSIVFNIMLIGLIWIFSLLSYNVIKEPQVVIINRPFPENKLLFPRESLLIYPFVFSFIVVYNIIFFKIKKIADKEIDKINFLFFLLILATEILIFIINY